MRKNRIVGEYNEISILALDDDKIMTLTLQSYFQSSGYIVDIENDPERAIERVRNGHYDILLLDFLMTPICGDEVVARIREFNKDIYILLLTGHKSLAPPIKTIRELDIQGYYEKSDRFDQLELLVESCVKSIRQMYTIRDYRDQLKKIADGSSAVYKLQTLEELLETLFRQSNQIFGRKQGFVYIDGTHSAVEKTLAVQTSISVPYFYEKDSGKDVHYAERWMNVFAQNTARMQDIESGYDLFPLMDEKHHVFGVFRSEERRVGKEC